jgi:subtilisin family serine protease
LFISGQTRATMTMEFFYLIVVMLTFLLLPSASASLGSHRKLNRAIGSEAIPGQYIIALDSNIPNSRGFATHILKRAFRNNIIATYDYAMKGFAVKDLPDMLLHFILNMDDVISVSEDAVVKAETVQTDPTWGLDIIDGQADNLYSYAFTGQGVDVYVLDTGIQANHPDLEGRVESCVSYSGEECGSDLNGHGTHVTGTVGSKTYGVAKKASLHDVKVLNQNGSGSYVGVIAGIDYVAQINNADPSRNIVMNLSLGGGFSPALNSAINSAADSGVVVVVAAGNSNEDACNSSPASAERALVVGSINNSNQRSVWSNWGSCVDIFAPGSGILSLSPNSGTSTKWGTSMASPHVAGVAALYLQARKSTDFITSDGLEDQLSSNLEGSPNLRISTAKLPLVALPTQSPSRAPTRQPTPAPTLQPTREPTGRPTPSPSNEPSEDAVPNLPTIDAIPLIEPDSSPPTKTPASFPTNAPVPPPTRAPTKAPSSAPSNTRAPTKAPTGASVTPPTSSPVLPQCQSSGQVCTAFRRCCRGLRCLRSWSPQRGRHRACRPRW